LCLIRTPTSATRSRTPSLHDALPIFRRHPRPCREPVQVLELHLFILLAERVGKAPLGDAADQGHLTALEVGALSAPAPGPLPLLAPPGRLPVPGTDPPPDPLATVAAPFRRCQIVNPHPGNPLVPSAVRRRPLPRPRGDAPWQSCPEWWAYLAVRRCCSACGGPATGWSSSGPRGGRSRSAGT